jgi:hypothetical protein
MSVVDGRLDVIEYAIERSARAFAHALLLLERD